MEWLRISSRNSKAWSTSWRRMETSLLSCDRLKSRMLRNGARHPARTSLLSPAKPSLIFNDPKTKSKKRPAKLWIQRCKLRTTAYTSLQSCSTWTNLACNCLKRVCHPSSIANKSSMPEQVLARVVVSSSLVTTRNTSLRLWASLRLRWCLISSQTILSIFEKLLGLSLQKYLASSRLRRKASGKFMWCWWKTPFSSMNLKSLNASLTWKAAHLIDQSKVISRSPPSERTSISSLSKGNVQTSSRCSKST